MTDFPTTRLGVIPGRFPYHGTLANAPAPRSLAQAQQDRATALLKDLEARERCAALAAARAAEAA